MMSRLWRSLQGGFRSHLEGDLKQENDAGEPRSDAERARFGSLLKDVNRVSAAPADYGCCARAGDARGGSGLTKPTRYAGNGSFFNA